MSRPSSPATNRRIQTFRDALQSAKFSTNYDPKDDNKSTEGLQEQARQAGNDSTKDERGNSFGDRILNTSGSRGDTD
jgi:hypothetical protein